MIELGSIIELTGVDLSFYWGAMGSFSKIGALISIVSVVVFMGSIMLTGTLESHKIDQVILEVDYYENWNISYSSGNVIEYWSGIGRKELLLVRPLSDTWVISVQGEKLDASSSQFKITLKLKDGSVIEQAVTLQPYGKVNIIAEIP
jgi:hypothetical protein